MNQLSLLKEWVYQSSSEVEIIESIRNGLSSNQLYEVGESHLGGDVRDFVADGITIDTQENKTAKSIDAVEITLLNFKQIYLTKQSRLKNVFTLCMISLSVAIFLILGGVFILISGVSEDNIMSIITTSSSIIPTLFSGSIFLFYSKIKKESDLVEAEILRTNKLLIFFKLIDSIKDEEAQKKAYNEIIESLAKGM